MSAMSVLLLAAAASAAADVVAVRVGPAESRTALQVLTTAEPSGVEARREGGEVVIVLETDAPDGLALPPPSPPIEAVRLDREEGRTVLRVKVAPEVPFELRRGGTVVTVLLGEPGLGGTVPIEELYRGLFPGAAPEALPEGPAREDERGELLGLRGLRLRPALVLGYVDADVAASATGEPVRERYFEVQPLLRATLSFWGGRIRAGYEPRFRAFTSLAGLGTTTHLADVALDLTVAQRLELQARHHFAHGVLETTEVDRGREYFFPLGRFNRNDTGLGARFEMTPRLGLETSAGWNRVDVDQPAGFPGYDQNTFRAGLGYELGPRTRASLGYERLRVPAPVDRPVIEAVADSVFLALFLSAEGGAALSGQAEVSYRDQRNLRAPSGGQRFGGLNGSATLRRTLGVRTVVEIGGGRGTGVSGFEQNAFYVSNSLRGGVTATLIGDLSVQAGASRIWNRYRLPASAIGSPRADDLSGWSVGMSRPFGRQVFLRADYRRDRRDSNLPGFDLVNRSLAVQLGIGRFTEGLAR